MNILYFASVDFYQKPNPSFHLMYTMITDLLENGHTINYIGCAMDDIENHVPSEFKEHPHFNYELVKIPHTNKSNFSKRYLDGVLYAIKAKKHIKDMLPSSDLVFIQSSPTALYNILSIRKFSKRKKIVYNVQDMFPGSSIASGVMPKTWMQNIFYFLQKKAYKLSDVIVAISDDMKSKLVEQAVPEEKIKVIVNWFDDSSVDEISWNKNKFVKKYALDQDKFFVQYAGTMGYVFDYKIVLEVASLLKNYHDIVFQMIGEGSQKIDFIDKAKQNKLDNIVFLPLEPQNMVSDVYSACSVCFIPLKKGIIGNSVPSKAALLMACKRAIITSSDEDSLYNKMINEEGIGIAVSSDDPKGVADAILKLKANPKLRVDMGVRGYEYGSKMYSRSYNMKKYMDLFKDLV